MAMNTQLKRLLKQRMKSKNILMLFSTVLVILIVVYIFVLLPSSNTSEAKKEMPISAEDIGTNGATYADNNVNNLLAIDYIDDTETVNSELITVDKETTVEKDIPFFIETIEANETVCIGEIELKSGSAYTINASAESGERIFVALNETDNISKYKGVVWHQYTGISGNQIEARFTDLQTGIFYVYVGNTGQEPLANVRGSITIDKTDETQNNELEKQDEIPSVEKDIPFLIETIGVNEAVCIGKIELKSGSSYTINASIESGEKIFVALNESDNISNYKGIVWHQFTGVNKNEIEARFTDLQTGTFYVYVGNTGQEPLINVNGILYIEQH